MRPRWLLFRLGTLRCWRRHYRRYACQREHLHRSDTLTLIMYLSLPQEHAGEWAELRTTGRGILIGRLCRTIGWRRGELGRRFEVTGLVSNMCTYTEG